MRTIFIAVVATMCTALAATSQVSAAPADGSILGALTGSRLEQAQYYGGYGYRRCPYGYYYVCWRDYYGRRACGCRPRY